MHKENIYLKNRSKKEIYLDLDNFLKKNYKKEKKVLDIGCGSGIYINLAKRIGYFVKACDYNPKNCIYDYIKVDKCDLNEEKLPYSNNEFEIIILTEVIEHIYNPGFLISEIYRVLKKGGKLYLTTPNLTNIKNKIWFLLFSHFLTHPNNPKMGDHITHIPPHFIKSFLERYYFKEIKIRYLNSFFPYTKLKLPNCPFLSDTVVIEAKKLF